MRKGVRVLRLHRVERIGQRRREEHLGVANIEGDPQRQTADERANPHTPAGVCTQSRIERQQ